jgi:hypothetical protein
VCFHFYEYICFVILLFSCSDLESVATLDPSHIDDMNEQQENARMAVEDENILNDKYTPIHEVV